MGVADSIERADKASFEAKVQKKAKHGAFNKDNPGAFREKGKHGESFVVVAEPEIGERVEVAVAKPTRGELEQARRGTIKFKVDGTGKAYDFDIRALRGDKTTLAHETAHWMSWSLHELAAAADAPEGIRADYAALLRFAGWGDAKERLADNLERNELKEGTLTEGQRAAR
jgi:hypothetical protein